MGHQYQAENYVRLCRRWRQARGFRLNPNRFSVRRLQAKLLRFFSLLGRRVRLLTRGLAHTYPASRSASGSRRGGLVGHDGHRPQTAKPARLSYMRSNSFYAQAIADCLEFIKRNSVPVEDYGSVSARR